MSKLGLSRRQFLYISLKKKLEPIYNSKQKDKILKKLSKKCTKPI